jgi:acyl-CoA thioesterase FadM
VDDDGTQLRLCEARIRIGWVNAQTLRPERIPATVLAAVQGTH